MITIKALWEDFKKKVYPQGMTPMQEYQVKAAFYAGAEIVFEHVGHASSQKTEEEAMKVLSGFMKEINEFAGSLATKGKGN